MEFKAHRNESEFIWHNNIAEGTFIYRHYFSRQELQTKFETMKELEEVKKARTEAKSYEPDVNEVIMFLSKTDISLLLQMIGELQNYRNFDICDEVMEKQNVEKMEKTKKKVDSQSYENSEVKCVRFNETLKEKEISVDKNTDEDNTKFEDKVKMKLKQIKDQTEKEVSKLSNMKSKPMQIIENKRERARYDF